VSINRDPAAGEDEASRVVLELDWERVLAPVGEVVGELHCLRQLLCPVSVSVSSLALGKKEKKKERETE
jgi:hypothetical protein